MIVLTVSTTLTSLCLTPLRHLVPRKPRRHVVHGHGRVVHRHNLANCGGVTTQYPLRDRVERLYETFESERREPRGYDQEGSMRQRNDVRMSWLVHVDHDHFLCKRIYTHITNQNHYDHQHSWPSSLSLYLYSSTIRPIVNKGLLYLL